jgi:hypothetical protein
MFLTDPLARKASISRHAGIAMQPEVRLWTRVPRSTSPSSVRPNLFSGD